MQNQINKLKKIRDKALDLIERRDKAALIRSDEWYHSEKGKNHETATATLADATETINDAIKELEIYLKQTK